MRTFLFLLMLCTNCCFLAAQSPPHIPRLISASDSFASYVDIIWEAIPNIKYNIYRGDTKDPRTMILLNKTPVPSNRFRDHSKLRVGKIYYYAVRAITNTESRLSNIDEGRILPVAGQPQDSLNIDKF